MVTLETYVQQNCRCDAAPVTINTSSVNQTTVKLEDVQDTHMATRDDATSFGIHIRRSW